MNLEIITYLSLLFSLSEFVLMLTKRSKNGSRKLKRDKSSLLLFWITLPLCITLGFFCAKRTEWSLLNDFIAIAGSCIFALGIIVRWTAILQLRKEFTVDVAVTKNHQLNMQGIYKHIRHPSYLGLLLICLGLSVAMNSIISLAVITIPIFLALIYRIKIEEKTLTATFGQTYQSYVKKSNKLIPKLY